jgi:hypothetical protein
MADAAPSISDAKTAYYANVGYDGPGGSVAMATAFVAACRVLLVLISKRVSHGGRAEEIEIDPTVIERQSNTAQRWIYAQNVRVNGNNVRIFRRGEPFVPLYPGPYYGD